MDLFKPTVTMANLTPDDRVAKRRTTTSLNSGDNQEHNDIIISLHNSHVRKKKHGESRLRDLDVLLC